MGFDVPSSEGMSHTASISPGVIWLDGLAPREETLMEHVFEKQNGRLLQEVSTENTVRQAIPVVNANLPLQAHTTFVLWL